MPLFRITRTCLLLHLPRELRDMIYLEFSSHFTDPEPEGVVTPSSYKGYLLGLRGENLTLAIRHLELIIDIMSLANTCYRIQDEMSETFFNHELARTQIHVDLSYPARQPTGLPNAARLPAINRQISDRLRSCPLFTQYVQHLSVHWRACSCRKGEHLGPSGWRHFENELPADQTTGLGWLGQCENLKTLEVVIEGSASAEMRADRDWSAADKVEDQEFCRRCQLQLVMLPPRTLTKVKFRIFTDRKYRPREGWPMPAILPHWEPGLVEWFWRERAAVKPELMPEGMNTTAENGIHQQEETVHEFRHHLGAVSVGWPLSRSV